METMTNEYKNNFILKFYNDFADNKAQCCLNEEGKATIKTLNLNSFKQVKFVLIYAVLVNVRFNIQCINQ